MADLKTSEEELDSNEVKFIDSENIYSVSNFQEGEIVKGRIVRVTKNEVFVDVGYKSEGVISIREFASLTNEINVKIGDEVSVYLERKEDKNGLIVISKIKADEITIWDKIEKAFSNKEVINGKVIKKIAGGLIVDIGVEAFLPTSQIDIKPKPKLEEYISKTIPLMIIKIDMRKNSIVLSHKQYLTYEKDRQINELWETIKEGEIKKGIVKNIVSYGAFVDIGGVDGLLYITDMTWSRISHPAEIMTVGDKIEVLVTKVDKDNKKISLGLKQKTIDPWLNIEEKYPIGIKVQGKVVNLVNYGAFVKLEEGVEGLLHISEISWTKKTKHPSSMLAIGDNIEAVVLSIDKESRKLALGMKQLEQDPWEIVDTKYKVGNKVKGVVSSFTDFGSFIELPDGIEGLLHISDMSWIKKVKHPSEILKKGEKVETVILKVDKKNKKLALGLKQLTLDTWPEIETKFTVGNIVSGKVSKILKSGIFVELEGEVEGLIHKSEISDKEIENGQDIFKIGDEIKAKVVKIDLQKRRIDLSIEAIKEEEKIENG